MRLSDKNQSINLTGKRLSISHADLTPDELRVYALINYNQNVNIDIMLKLHSRRMGVLVDLVIDSLVAKGYLSRGIDNDENLE